MDCYLPARSLPSSHISWQHLGQGSLLPLPIFPAIAICILLLFTFLLLREEAEELGINLVDDISKLLGIMLEVEVIHLYYQHPTLILVHNEIIVEKIDSLKIIDRHLLLVVTASFLNILHKMWYRRTEINHQFGISTTSIIDSEEFHIGIEVALVHITHLSIIGLKDIHALKMVRSLNDSLLTMLNLKQILESLLLQIEDLHIESPSGDVLVIVIDVGILCHWLQVLFPAVMLGGILVSVVFPLPIFPATAMYIFLILSIES